MKRLAILLVILVLVFLGYWFFLKENNKQSNTPTQDSSQKTLSMKNSKLAKRSVPDGPPDLIGDFEDDPVGNLRLEGQVVNEEGAGVEGVVIHLNSNPPRQTVSKEFGWFAFDDLVGRFYYLEAREQNTYGSLWTELSKESMPVTLRLETGVSLEVTVLDTRDRTPVEGAMVQEGWYTTSKQYTDSEGKVLLQGLKTGGWSSLLVSKEGYGIAQDWIRISQQDSLQKTVLLEPGAMVGGVVLSPSGEPVSGAKVSIQGASDGFFYGMRKDSQLVTDSEGRWQGPSIRDGSYRFRARHEQFAPGLSTLVTIDGKTPRDDIEIRLEEGGSISGVVLDSSGNPVPSALVLTDPENPSKRGNGKKGYSNEQGEFILEGLPITTLLVLAQEEDQNSEVVTVNLQKETTITNVTLTLQEDEIISGVVVDSKGDPVFEAMVYAISENFNKNTDQWRLRKRPTATTDPDGQFILKGIPEGEIMILSASIPGKDHLRSNTQEMSKAKAGDTDVRLVILDASTVTGTVAFEDGSVPETFTVYINRTSKSFTKTDAGEFLVENVPPGKARLWLMGPEISYEGKTIDVKAGEDIDLRTIVVKKGNTIEGKVVSQTGSPVVGATVVAGQYIGGSGGRLYTGEGAKTAISKEDGSFTISGLPNTSTLSIIAEHASKGRSESVQVPKGEEINITLTLLPGGSLMGTVSYKGNPIEAELRASTTESMDSGGFFTIRSGPDGKYRFDTLTPGTYRISVKKVHKEQIQSQSIPQIEEVSVTEGQTEIFDIALQGGTLVAVRVNKEGSSVENASILLSSIPIQARNTQELTALTSQMSFGGTVLNYIYKNAWTTVDTAYFEDVIPGSYTICAWENPSQEVLQSEGYDPQTSYPVSCEVFTVDASSEVFEITKEIF